MELLLGQKREAGRERQSGDEEIGRVERNTGPGTSRNIETDKAKRVMMDAGPWAWVQTEVCLHT